MSAGLPPQSPVAKYEEHKFKPFELYQKCRYNEFASTRLMRRYVRIEGWIKRTTLLAITLSLVVGSFSFLSKPQYAPIWAFFALLATITSVIGLFVGSGAKQFHWFSIARAFGKTLTSPRCFPSMFVWDG